MRLASKHILMLRYWRYQDMTLHFCDVFVSFSLMNSIVIINDKWVGYTQREAVWIPVITCLKFSGTLAARWSHWTIRPQVGCNDQWTSILKNGLGSNSQTDAMDLLLAFFEKTDIWLNNTAGWNYRSVRQGAIKKGHAQKENAVLFYGKTMENCIFSQKWYLLIKSVNYREISAFTQHSSGTVGCVSAKQRWSEQIKMVKSNDCVTNAFLDQLLWSVRSHMLSSRGWGLRSQLRESCQGMEMPLHRVNWEEMHCSCSVKVWI